MLDRLLRLGADVRPGEGPTAILLSIAGFLTLASYYTVRPLRSAFLLPVNLALPGGIVIDGPLITSYSGAVLAVVFLFSVPAYGALASRVNRMRLINLVSLFFTTTLLVFYAFGQRLPPAALGIGFFLWVGVFNLMVQAQFWSFANDLYSQEQGKRLFAIVGVGATVGGVAGARIASAMIRDFGEFAPMPVAAALLLVFMLVLNVVNLRESGRTAASVKGADAPLGSEGGFQLVLKHRYLLLIGLLTLAVQIANTNGNYILDQTLTESARAVAGTSAGLSERQFIGAFRAEMDFYQNILVVLIQFFLVSRIFKYIGVRRRAVHPAFARAHPLRRIRRLAGVGVDSHRQNRRERHGLLAAEHPSPGAVPAHEPRSEVQGAAGSRDVLLARRRHAVRDHHSGRRPDTRPGSAQVRADQSRHRRSLVADRDEPQAGEPEARAAGRSGRVTDLAISFDQLHGNLRALNVKLEMRLESAEERKRRSIHSAM